MFARSHFRFGQANLEDTRKRTEAADDQARLKFNERFFDEKRQQYSDQVKHLDVRSTAVLPSDGLTKIPILFYKRVQTHIRRVQREMREVRQKELEQEKRVKGAQFTRLQRANEKESLEREVASKRRDFTHKYVRELIGAQRLELHLSQQLAQASTALEEVCFQSASIS